MTGLGGGGWAYLNPKFSFSFYPDVCIILSTVDLFVNYDRVD